MNSQKDLLAKIQSMSPKFSKGQKLIANYIIDNYDKAAFMTASKLGITVGVSESTVVRFSTSLGFDGYPKFQKALQDLIRIKLTAVQRIEISSHRIDYNDVLKSVFLSDIEKLRITMEEASRETFDEVVNTITGAKRIYILGVRSSGILANFLAFYFNLIFDNVQTIQASGTSDIFEQILRIGPDDLLIGISFPRYSSQTVKALKFSKDRGAKVVAITDTMNSPMVPYATHVLTAKSDIASFVDSLVAPLSLINALIVAVGMKKNQSIYSIFEELESIWDEYGVYEKFDDEE